MMELVSRAGPWVYPLLGIGLCLLVAIVRAAIVIMSMDRGPHPAGPPHNTVIAWGVLGGVVGLLGTLVGFARLAVSARQATGAQRVDLEALLDVLWGGAAVIVAPVTLGLWLFSVAVVAWLVLQYLLGRRVGGA